MRSSRLIITSLVMCFICHICLSQNVVLNVLTQNSGIIKKGHTVFIEVTVNNPDVENYVGVYKLNVQVSVPAEIASIPLTGHNLPRGWTITSNNGSTINLSNGTDMIAASDARTLLIAIKGEKVGGPLTVSGKLSFSNGKSPGTEPGTMQGDNPADNSSTSTCTIIR